MYKLMYIKNATTSGFATRRMKSSLLSPDVRYRAEVDFIIVFILAPPDYSVSRYMRLSIVIAVVGDLRRYPLPYIVVEDFSVVPNHAPPYNILALIWGLSSL